MIQRLLTAIKPMAVVGCLAFQLSACSPEQTKGLPVGSACTKDDQCDGPGTPQCIVSGLYPLSALANSTNKSAQSLATIGVNLPDGYCSTRPPCQRDADCGLGGTCFFPLQNVDPVTYSALVAALSLPETEAAVLQGFMNYGQCLEVCHGAAGCDRPGYVCQTPISDFLMLVPDADIRTFCIGKTASCSPNPCLHGTCKVKDAATVTCECSAGWTGDSCDQAAGCGPLTADLPLRVVVPSTELGGVATYSCADGYDLQGDTSRTCQAGGWDGQAPTCIALDWCSPNPCQNGGSCQNGASGYTCSCAQGFTGATCEIEVSGCADQPCVHAIQCIDQGPGQYSCECQEGYEGTNCDRVKDLCAGNPCQNNGTCEMWNPGVFICHCQGGYSGDLCEIASTTTVCLLTYNLAVGNGADNDTYTGCNIRIRDTFMGMGDSTSAVGPGTLILRVPSDGGQNPANGTAEILYFELTQEFTRTFAGTTVATDVDAASPQLGQTGNSNPQATGTFAMGATPTVSWAQCSYPAGYNNTNQSFTPDVVGTGAGCLAPYRSTGNVNCSGVGCSAGGLDSGDNPQDETWEQALQSLTFAADLSSFTMPFMLVPDRSPSRTYISLAGTLASKVCQ